MAYSQNGTTPQFPVADTNFPHDAYLNLWETQLTEEGVEKALPNCRIVKCTKNAS